MSSFNYTVTGDLFVSGRLTSDVLVVNLTVELLCASGVPYDLRPLRESTQGTGLVTVVIFPTKLEVSLDDIHTSPGFETSIGRTNLIVPPSISL